MKRYFLASLFFCFFCLGASGQTRVKTDHVQAQLLAYAPEGIKAGKSFWLGLEITHKPGWHTYWKNPGDSGTPVTFNWKAPEGIRISGIDWITPQPLPSAHLMNYGYQGTVLFPVSVSVSDHFFLKTLRIRLLADWLVCEEDCIPESGEFLIELPVGPVLDRHHATFTAFLEKRPQKHAFIRATGKVADDRFLKIEVTGLPENVVNKKARFLPEQQGLIDHAAPVRQLWQSGNWQGEVELSSQRSISPETLSALLLFDDGAYHFETPLTGWHANAQAPMEKIIPPTAGPAGQASLPVALGLAFLGGLLLNLMPCVFPILSLKIFGFSQHADNRRRLVMGGVSYTAGVILSFLALAGLLLALKSAGRHLGWGFQLQEPWFVAALAVLFTLIGLNLAGVFELRLLLPSSGALPAKHPAVESFLTGILAVIVASPCTAPFMGAALGLAVTLPALEMLLVFAFLGTGLALPYLVASLIPGIGRFLPQSGPWMLRFRTLMAFPMFGTVIWLLWVLGQQSGQEAIIGMLASLLALSLLVWAFVQPGASRWWLGILALLVCAAALTWTIPALQTKDTSSSAMPVRWEAWSAEKVEQYRQSGRPVFVDFTAAWCVTCQVNKKGTLSNQAVLEAFDEKNVVLLRADWTSRDPKITAELARLGRAGVPAYALYSPDQNRPPLLLHELLIPEEIFYALSTLNP